MNKLAIVSICLGILCYSYTTLEAQHSRQNPSSSIVASELPDLLPGKYLNHLRSSEQATAHAKGVPGAASSTTYDKINVFQPSATLWDQLPWPNPQINFLPSGVNVPVGDLTGNGVIDMMRVYNNVPDDRTSDISDLVNKTLIFLGGNMTTEPDFIVYEVLFITGDVTGDGKSNLHADNENGEVTVYSFTQDSYTAESFNSSALSGDFSNLRQLEADFNGNGHNDAAAIVNNQLRLRFGADNVDELTTKIVDLTAFLGNQIHPDITSRNNYSSMLAGSFEKNGQVYIGVLVGVYWVGDYSGQNLIIISIDESSNLSVEQVITVPPSWFNINTLVRGGFFTIPGSAERETKYIYSHPSGLPIQFTISDDENFILNPSYSALNTVFISGEFFYVGDMFGDGSKVFLRLRDGGYHLYRISGNNALISPLTSLIPDDIELLSFSPPLHTYYGDQTGDGRDNFFISYTDVNGDSGQLMLSHDGSSSNFREGLEVVNISYSAELYDRIVAERTYPLGDITGNGSDDFLIQYISGTNVTLIMHQGGNNWKTPYKTWELEHVTDVLDVVSGYFTDLTRRDIALLVRQIEPGQTLFESSVLFIEGGPDPADTPYLVLPSRSTMGANFQNAPNIMEAIGDVNNNGYDDLLLSPSTHLWNTSTFLPLALYYGGPELSDRPPDQYIGFESPGSFGAGGTIKALGDLNGDGIDDFMIVNINEGFEEDFQRFGVNAGGRAHIFYGQSGTPDFSTPDITLQADTTQMRNGISFWAFGMNEVGVGDFNGDGNLDIAIIPFRMHFADNLFSGVPGIHIFHGADIQNAITQPAQLLPIWSEYHWPSFNDSFIGYNGRGLFHGVPDLNNNGSDELLFVPGNGYINASLYLGGSTMAARPAALYESPNNYGLARTGNFIDRQYRSTVGDFTGDGVINFIGVQPGDPNFRSTPIYMYDLTPPQPVSANDYISDLPERTALAQNFPNPFNPTTTIRYELSSDSHVTLEVFDLLGRSVGKLVNGRMEAGEHSVQFDAAHLSSGVYLYRLNAGGAVYTRKMMLVK